MPGVDTIGDGGIMARLRALELKVAQLAKTNPLRSASITEGGLVVGGNGWIHSDNWNGTSQAVPGTVGWALGGPLGTAIINTLVLRQGIIGNDALTNPITVATAQNWTQGWGLPNPEQTLATASIVVPAGFTNAAVLVFVNFSILGTAGSGDSYVRCWAGASHASSVQSGAASTAFLYADDAITMSAFGVFSFADLNGGTISITARAAALAGAKPSAPANLAAVGGLALLTR